MHNILIIMSAGKNSRFDGMNKIFADINGKTNIQNTYDNAKEIFDEIYLAIDPRYFIEYDNVPNDIKILETIGGYGELYSIYYVLQKLPYDENNIITICWGDAIFNSNKPFIELLENYSDDDIYVAVSVDKEPYAWFDVQNDYIIKSHFRKDDGIIDAGIHDQSLFGFKRSVLESMEKYISILTNGEYKTLKYFEWLITTIYKPAKICYITKNNVFSFNTKEELKRIIKC